MHAPASPFYVALGHLIKHTIDTVFKRVGAPNVSVSAITYLLRHEAWSDQGHSDAMGLQINPIFPNLDLEKSMASHCRHFTIE